MTTISVIDEGPAVRALGLWATGRYALAPREEYFPPDKTVERGPASRTRRRSGIRSRPPRSPRCATSDYPKVVYVGDDPGRLAQRRSAGAAGPDRRRSTARRSRTSPRCRPRWRGTTPGQVGAGHRAARGRRNRSPEGHPRRQPGGRQPGLPGHRRGGAAGRAVHHSIALEDIGGPSAGLMFTLGIIDKLTDGDLTGGTFIAGTGTIDPRRRRSARSAGCCSS